MAKNVKTLPFPSWLLTVDYSLTLNNEGISEDGEPIVAFTHSGKCIFSEKTKRIIDTEGKQITLLGTVIVEGDIAPELKTVSDGTIIINERQYEIHSCYRPRNPNGTVHHTTFEVK